VFGLALAVWPKNYLYPADEQTLLAYVNQLQETYVAAATEATRPNGALTSTKPCATNCASV